MTDRKAHLQVGFSIRRRSRFAIYENTPVMGVFSLRRPFLHTPSTQTYPIWVRSVYGVQNCMLLFLFYYLCWLLTTNTQKFIHDGQDNSPSSKVSCSSLFCTGYPQEHTHTAFCTCQAQMHPIWVRFVFSVEIVSFSYYFIYLFWY